MLSLTKAKKWNWNIEREEDGKDSEMFSLSFGKFGNKIIRDDEYFIEVQGNNHSTWRYQTKYSR